MVCQPTAAGSAFTRLLREKKILSDFCLTGTDSWHAGIQFLRKNKTNLGSADRRTLRLTHRTSSPVSACTAANHITHRKKICSMSVYSDLDAQYPQTITGNSQWHILHLKDEHGCCVFSHCAVSGLTSGSRLYHYLSRTSYIRGGWRQQHIAMATEPAVLRHVWAEDAFRKYMRVYMWRNKVCEHFKGGCRQTTWRRHLIIVGHLTVLENDIHHQFSVHTSWTLSTTQPLHTGTPSQPPPPPSPSKSTVRFVQRPHGLLAVRGKLHRLRRTYPRADFRLHHWGGR